MVKPYLSVPIRELCLKSLVGFLSGCLEDSAVVGGIESLYRHLPSRALRENRVLNLARCRGRSDTVTRWKHVLQFAFRGRFQARFALRSDGGYSSCMIDVENFEVPRRGMPRWRERQRLLPIAEKIRLIGQCVLETRELERIKAKWKQSATCSNSSFKTGQ